MVLPRDSLELAVVVAESVEAAPGLVGLLEEVEALLLDRGELAPELADARDTARALDSREEEGQTGAAEEQRDPMAARQLQPLDHACL
jgi:hypothetical protein